MLHKSVNSQLAVELSLWLFSVVLLTTCAGSVRALDANKTLDQYVYRNWTTDDGLPQAVVVNLVQDDEGYIWMTTQAGLVRFNGSQFKLFNVDNTGGKLPADLLGALKKDGRGRLWFSSPKGVGYYDHGEFHRVEIPGSMGKGLAYSITLDRENRLWLGTEQSGIYIAGDGETGHLTQKDGLLSNNVVSLLTDPLGCIWIATDKGLQKHLPTGKFIHYSEEHGLKLTKVTKLGSSPDGGVIWVASKEGLCSFESDRFHCVSNETEGFPKGFINSLMQDKAGNLWITTNEGLYRFSQGRFSQRRLPSYLLGTETRGMLVDTEGNLWVGTTGFGAAQVRDGKVYSFNPTPSVPDNTTWTVIADSSDNLWVGTQKGVVRRTPQGEMTRLGTEDGLFSNIIHGLSPAIDGGVWVGSTGGGLTHIDPSGAMRHLDRIPDWPYPKIHSILEEENGQLLIGTRQQGMLIFGPDGTLLKTFNRTHGLSGSRVNSILPAKKRGGYWLATVGGLSRYHKGKVAPAQTDTDLSKSYILSPYEDAEGRLWFGTVEDGLGLLQGTKVTLFGKQQGLPTNAFYSILEDDGYLWTSGDSGIVRLSKSELLEIAVGKRETTTVQKFDESDGMNAGESTGGMMNNAWKTKEGHLMFTALKGLVIADPKSLETNSQVPPVIIEELLIDGKSLYPGALLPPGEYRLEARFAGLSYTFPSDVRFKYFLEGTDSDWSEEVKENTVRYTNLSHGDYKLKVKASNNDGVWNETGASFGFVIEAPFYLKSWFWALVAIGFGLLVFATVRLVIYLERRRTKSTSELAWKRTRDILAGQVDAIRELISGASNVSTDMQDLMGQLSTSSEQVAAAVSETAATVEELERTSQSAEKNAEQIIQAVSNTAKEASTGRETVEQSVRAMMSIQEDSQNIEKQTRNLQGLMAKIESIITLVGEISEQSSVLSINASIEASKAGEYGSGFGIVAENMQDLSGRSREATIEIAEILNSVSKAISNIGKISKKGAKRMEFGVTSIQNSGRVVGNLAEEVEDNARLAETIAKSIEQQMTGLHYIAKAVGEFTGTVENNKKISKSVAIGSHALGQSIKDLLETIDNWKTPEFYR